MDELDCTGNERSLDQCQFGGWGMHDCWHTEDAGVHCINGSTNYTDGSSKRTAKINDFVI